jgi:hypothetical protein
MARLGYGGSQGDRAAAALDKVEHSGARPRGRSIRNASAWGA